MARLNREFIKENYPFVYKYLLGGERADEYTKKNLEALGVVSSTAGSVKEVAAKGFDIVVWIKENWQLAVLGLVALLVLLKD